MQLSKYRGFIVLIILVNLISLGVLLVSGTVFLKRFNNRLVVGTSYDTIISKPVGIDGTNEVQTSTYIIPAEPLSEANTLSIALDTNGLCMDENGSALLSLITRDGGQYSVSLANYAKNCAAGDQELAIPLSAFWGNKPVQVIDAVQLSVRHAGEFKVKFSGAALFSDVLGYKTKKAGTNRGRRLGLGDLISPKPSVTAAPTISPNLSPTAFPVLYPSASLLPTATFFATPSPLPTASVAASPVSTLYPEPQFSPGMSPSPSSIESGAAEKWQIRSVDSMKETKDRVCNQRSDDFIAAWVVKAKELGANYIAISTPYDSPECGDSLAYTKRWVNAIRSQGLHVWHRHMPLAFEGIYNFPKSASGDYLSQIENYVLTNPDLFKAGDIFTPVPEPQNGGISGITYCSHGTCIYKDSSHFNQWLREAMDRSSQAFTRAGVNGIEIGYWGFDGFVAWGHNNPDWTGILEVETVIKMGNITIDHYPELVGSEMPEDLAELTERYPNTPIIIGEWGAVRGVDPVGDVLKSMKAANDNTMVKGFNYWHMGTGGNEALVNESLTPYLHYYTVQNYFQ